MLDILEKFLRVVIVAGAPCHCPRDTPQSFSCPPFSCPQSPRPLKQFPNDFPAEPGPIPRHGSNQGNTLATRFSRERHGGRSLPRKGRLETCPTARKTGWKPAPRLIFNTTNFCKQYIIAVGTLGVPAMFLSLHLPVKQRSPKAMSRSNLPLFCVRSEAVLGASWTKAGPGLAPPETEMRPNFTQLNSPASPQAVVASSDAIRSCNMESGCAPAAEKLRGGAHLAEQAMQRRKTNTTWCWSPAFRRLGWCSAFRRVSTTRRLKPELQRPGRNARFMTPS